MSSSDNNDHHNLNPTTATTAATESPNNNNNSNNDNNRNNQEINGNGHHNSVEDGDLENDDDNNNNSKKPRLLLAQSTISWAEIQSEFSHHDPTVVRINNGSFGSCPSSVLSSQRNWQLLFLRQPDHFYFNTLQPSLLRSRTLLSSLLNSPGGPSHLSLLDNATTAAAVVLHSLSPDSALLLHHSYGAVKNSVHFYVSRSGGRVFEAPLPFPVSSDSEIVDSFRRALTEAKEACGRVRLAVIDHVTSMPSVVLPVKQLVRVCREEGVDRVFVDAAHGLGCVPVDLSDIGADFYTSNLHKWFFCPPSVAFLHCARGREEDDLHHPVVSHELGRGLPIESGWIGTRDYSAQLVVEDAIKFVGRFPGGLDGIRERNHEKVVEMGLMLARAWGTRLGCPPEMCSTMAMVGLPPCLGIGSESDALKLRTHLRECFGVEVPIYFRARPLIAAANDNAGVSGLDDGNDDDAITGYARISHQVYNKEEDYYSFRDAVNRLVSDGFTCASLH